MIVHFVDETHSRIPLYFVLLFQEELNALVDGLCVEAIAKILRMVELVINARKQHHPPSIELNKSCQTEEDLSQVIGQDSFYSVYVLYEQVEVLLSR